MQSLHNIHFVQERIQNALLQRVENGRLRQLTILDCPVDFRSNDYLGLSKSAWIRQQLEKNQAYQLGATGSRLLSGNTAIHQQAEDFLSLHYQSEAALIFNSGYDANVGLLSTIIRPEDTVFYDEAIHASMHQGLKLSGAKTLAFTHNDIHALKSLLESHANDGIAWIVCESYYSMDGDLAPLKEFVHLAEQYNAQIIVDEAHAIGCFGEKGRGLCSEWNLSEKIFARVVTFGKALGTHGAAVLCNDHTKQYLVNFCKPFIYSTALPPQQILHIQIAHQFLQNFSQAQNRLHRLIEYFKMQCGEIENLKGDGPVFSFIIPGEKAVRAKAKELQDKGLAIQPIVSPTVAKGSERLRIILHSYNTKEEIDILITSLKC